MVGDALRSLLIAPIFPVIFRVLLPIIDGFCCTLPFLEEVNVATCGGVGVIRAAGRAVHIVRALLREVFPIVCVGAVTVLIRLTDEKAVGVSAADFFEGNCAGERNGSGILLVVRSTFMIVVRAVPDGAHEFPFDGRLRVRPVRNVNDRFLHTALNDMKRISPYEHVDLPLGQFRRPSEKCHDEIMVGHPTALEVLGWGEIIGQTMQFQAKCPRDLGDIA